MVTNPPTSQIWKKNIYCNIWKKRTFSLLRHLVPLHHVRLYYHNGNPKMSFHTSFLHCITPCIQRTFCVALLSFFTLKNAMERSMCSSKAHVSCKVAQFSIQLEYLVPLLFNINPTHKYFLTFSNPWFYPTHKSFHISSNSQF